MRAETSLTGIVIGCPTEIGSSGGRRVTESLHENSPRCDLVTPVTKSTGAGVDAALRAAVPALSSLWTKSLGVRPAIHPG